MAAMVAVRLFAYLATKLMARFLQVTTDPIWQTFKTCLTGA